MVQDSKKLSITSIIENAIDEITIFNKLSAIDVAHKISKRKTGKIDLNYLSWADALDMLYAQFNDKDVDFKVFYNQKRDDDLPIFGNAKVGYYVKTLVTIQGITREMILPIMDGANNPLKDDKYSYTTSYGNKTVEALDICDINKAVMRCLVKNIALFGLGISVYTGEDLPEDKSVATYNNAPVKPAIAYDDEKDKQSQKAMINSYLKNSANKKYIDFKDGEPSNTIRNYCDSQMDDSSAKLGTLVALVNRLGDMGCTL